MSQLSKSNGYHIVIAVGQPDHLPILLAVGAQLARARKGQVTPIYVGQSRLQPDWLTVPQEYADVVAEPILLSGTNAAGEILDQIRKVIPDLLLLHWSGQPSRGRYLLGRTLDPLIQYSPCAVGVVRVQEDPAQFVERMQNLERIMVPSGGGPNATLAMQMALDLAPEARVTVLRVASRNLGHTAVAEQWEALRSATAPFAAERRLQPRVIQAASIVGGIVGESEEYDLTMIGATRESYVDRLIFGNLPQELVTRVPGPLIILRRPGNRATSVIRRAGWRVINVMTQLTDRERVTIYRQVRGQSRADSDFYVMMTLAGAIAALGLLLDSAAVIIGAMLVAPMMSALLGISIGIVQGDARMLRIAIRTTLIGTLIVLGVSTLVGIIVPIERITSEMLGRSSPTLLDLGVALVSGAAAAYATAREDVASSLPGVAVAVALVPPIATLGLVLLFGDQQAALGALLLFATNLIAIVTAGALLFLWMGFRPNIGEEETRARTFRGGVLGTLVLLTLIAVVLGFYSVTSFQRWRLHSSLQDTLADRLSAGAPEVELLEWNAERLGTGGVAVEIVIGSPEPLSEEQARQLRDDLAKALDRPVTLSISTIPRDTFYPDSG